MEVLYRAIRDGNVEKLRELLTIHRHLIDERTCLGYTLLHEAASYGRISVIELLIQFGSKAIDDMENQFKETPIFKASQDGHALVVEALVQLESQTIDVPNYYRWTPMYIAASNGHSTVIETLVRLGSKAIDTPTHGCRTPMHAAASNGHVRAVEMLVRMGSQAIDIPNYDDDTPIVTAILFKRVSTIRTLRYLGARVTRQQEKELGVYDENDAAEVRRRVFFHRSLLDRCLFEI